MIIKALVADFISSKILCFQHILMNTFRRMRLNYENYSLRRILFQTLKQHSDSLRKKCTYSDLFWSVFSSIRSKYGEIRSISPYSVRMRENTDQKNSEYGHFSRSEILNNMNERKQIFNNKIDTIKTHRKINQ